MSESLVPAATTRAPQLSPGSTHHGAPFSNLPEDAGDDGSIDPRRTWGIIRRHLWLILFCVAGGGAIGLLLTWRATPVYEATASLRITEGENSLPGLDVLEALGGGQTEVNTELEVLRSRTLVQRVVDTLGLRLSAIEPRKSPRSALVRDVAVAPDALLGRYEVVRSDNAWTVSAPNGAKDASAPDGSIKVGGLSFTILPISQRVRRFTLEVKSADEAFRTTNKALKIIRPTRDANVLTVTWRGSDPEIVPAVPNSLVRAFITRRVATRKAGARSTVTFLNAQIDTLARELKSAEADLRAYRESSGVVSFDEQAKLSVGTLASLQADRNQVAAELASLEGTLRDIRARPSDSSDVSQWRQLLAFPTLLKIPSLGALLESLNTLEGSRSELLIRRTPKDPEVMALTDQIVAIEKQVRSLVLTYMEGLKQQVAAADKTLLQSSAELRRIPAEEVRLAELQRRTQVLGDLFTLLQTKRKEAEIAEAVEDPSAQIVDFAQRPDKPVSPVLALNVAASSILGLVIALLVAFGRETLDTKLHTSEQLQDITGLPVLGIIPHFAIAENSTSPKLLLKRLIRTNGVAIIAPRDVQSQLHEAFRVLRVNIAFSSSVRPPKMLLVTSAFPSEGKSTSVTNLVTAMAEQRLRVLVVDADMRRGALHKNLKSNRSPGLSEILVGRVEPLAAVQPVSFERMGGVDFIATGTIPPNPAELLGGDRFLSFLKTVEPLYDVVLFDSPPVNSVSDSLLIAAHMDGVLLVARGGKTDRSGLRFAQDQLVRVRARILGAILNDYDIRIASYYGGYYNQDYSQDYKQERES